MVIHPMLILAAGIVTVIGLILIFRLNAFLALIIAAMLVSLMAPGPIAEKISRVAFAFGTTAGNIGIVIALAAVIGTCMMDSGAADRIVRGFLNLLGQKRAPIALMGSGFVLAVPVFFDTVFYLLVPLGRSLFKRTGKHYIQYVLAIGCGGAITHTLVPPTPGPLLMASNLQVDLGLMIMIGILVAIPSAIVGLAFAAWADRRMDVPMRPVPGMEEKKPLETHQLPPLWLAVMPVVLPVLLISANTILKTLADSEHAARFHVADVGDWPAFAAPLLEPEPPIDSVEARLVERVPEHLRPKLTAAVESGEFPNDLRSELLNSLNENVLVDRTFAGTDLSRKPEAEVERENRLVLEEFYPETVLRRHVWATPKRRASNVAAMFGDPNLALLLATVVAVLIFVRQRHASRTEVSKLVEVSLMSGGVIILITSAGGAFGEMLKVAEIGPAIEDYFRQNGGGSGLALMVLGFIIAAVLKVAQGSGTVSMITASGMLAALVPSPDVLGFNPVYLATAVGSGSLIGSWMNDSGFWVFAKMSGLTEAETLQSWTVLLLVLGSTGLVVSAILAFLLPLI